MARAETITKLSLDRWATLLGINPLHFNGVYVRAPTVCEQPWLQFAFQSSDRVGREEVANAIATAEANIEQELGFRLAPAWEIDEWRPTVRPWRPELINYSNTDIRAYGQVAQADWGYLVSGGIRAKTVVSAGAGITYSDGDGDGYSETATVTVAGLTFTDPCEVAVYYPVGGPVLDAGDDEWRIRPISVSISAGTATIRFRREQVVQANLQTDLVPPTDDSHLRGVDGLVDANFLASIDVYRIYNDPQQQVQFLWEPKGCSTCGGTGCNVCSYSTQMGCLMLRGNPRQSIVVYNPATWNSTTLQFDSAALAVARQPDLVRLWYYGGWRDKSMSCPTLQMDRVYEQAVAYYAAAMLERPLCECNNIKAFVDHWQQDLSMTGARKSQISSHDLMNPFGTQRGAIFAWNRLDRARATGVLA